MQKPTTLYIHSIQLFPPYESYMDIPGIYPSLLFTFIHRQKKCLFISKHSAPLALPLHKHQTSTPFSPSHSPPHFFCPSAFFCLASNTFLLTSAAFFAFSVFVRALSAGVGVLLFSSLPFNPPASLSSFASPISPLNLVFFSPALRPSEGTSSACRHWMTSAEPMVFMSRSCLGKERIGRLVSRSWSGVRGMLFLFGRGERERCVLRRRAVVLCSLGFGSVERSLMGWLDRQGGGWKMVARRKGMEGAIYLAFILRSNASYFFCSSALAVVRFLIFSSWYPFAFARSAVLV